jgi:hypothetical protein
MQFSAILAATILSLTASAAPTPEAVSMSAGQQWTLTSVRRVCNSNDSQCTWTFGIDTHSGAVQPCTIVVNAAGGRPASNSDWQNAFCGKYRINGGWSGQFGPGFTTLPVVDDAAHLIAYPAYEDSALVNGNVVSPDRSFNVERVPGF